MLISTLIRFLEDNTHKTPFAASSKCDPKEKLAAYLMGRWKNGMFPTTPSLHACLPVSLLIDEPHRQEPRLT